MTISTKTSVSTGKTRRRQSAEPTTSANEASTSASHTSAVLLPLPTSKGASRLTAIIMRLQGPDGASLAELCEITGWQAHSIRGAIAGAIKRKGYVVTSSVIDGTRRYRIATAP